MRITISIKRVLNGGSGGSDRDDDDGERKGDISWEVSAPLVECHR